MKLIRWYPEYLLRALASSLLSLLLVTTLIGGGCLSCEQFFMFGGSHGCCNPDGHCKSKVPGKSSSDRDCKQIAFDHQKASDTHFDLPVVTTARIVIPIPSNMEGLPRWRDALPTDPSPPDLQVLHSIFLI
ncbi:MAG TPA: hypothetical protein VH351_18995 [Bryobacteraceae bacterium]|jgi:hypothetical protein|nr:hypothetical protein [Bryobacteraceae bacterium]